MGKHFRVLCRRYDLNNLATVCRMDRRATSVPVETSGVLVESGQNEVVAFSELDASGDGETAEAERSTADGSF